jgi:hypothetical protein
MPEEKIDSVNEETEVKAQQSGSVNLGRHQAQCTICSSPYRQQIEEEWISWRCTKNLAEIFGVSRDALYRHANALGLFSKRRENILMALEQIIERVDRTPMNGSDILAAIRVHVKINSGGEEAERMQSSDPEKLFKRMSEEERLAFAIDGSLPDWFSRTKAATPNDGQKSDKESEVTETKGLQ